MTYATPASAGSATAKESGRKGRHMASKPQAPTITLDATDLHAPEAIRLLARKVRGVDPRRADDLERTAKTFETWRQAYIRR